MAKFKVGDKVWGGISRLAEPYAIIKELRYEKKVSNLCGTIVTTETDVTLTYPNSEGEYRTQLSKLSLANKAILTINHKSKWEVNDFLCSNGSKKLVKMDNGYFGAYSHIELGGKEAIVYVDDRDAKVIMTCGFYDKIFYGGDNTWSGDRRWNNDNPLIVYKKRLGYNLVAPHTNILLLDKWLKDVELTKGEVKWKSARSGDVYIKYISATDKQGNEVIVTNKGSIRLAKCTTIQNLQNLLNSVKTFSEEEVRTLWIEKDFPCAYIRGLEYKGRSAHIITKENALEYYKTHKNFNSPFQSAEWRILDAQVVLLFRDYCDSDYD